jgi:formylglycine-generating enzyme required for sulfatase activity
MPPLSRKEFLATALSAGGTLLLLPASRRIAAVQAAPPAQPLATQYSAQTLNENIIPAPSDPVQWPAFRGLLAQWRAETRARLRYDDALYRRAEFAWVASHFSCCFAMVCDETFLDPQTGRYRVESFLDHGQREFGGYDSLVLWHAYPRIGVDDRNQFDFYRDLPGGLPGLRVLSRACHARGVRVFIDYNPWDTGTRREGRSDIDMLAWLVGEIEADGIFLDTMSKGAAEFRTKLDAVRLGVVLEGENALPLENIPDHHMSWAQWFRDSAVPGILRNKWYERRHLQHQIKRWDHDHSGELHSAWMNGSGMMVWENVFGSWVGWSERDRSILRAMLPIQRRYWRLFCGEAWQPLVPTTQSAVYASLWENHGIELWTLVNRSEQTVQGALLEISARPGARYFDLIAGQEFSADAAAGKVVLAGSISPRGIGCIVAGSPTVLGEDFAAFLASQRGVNERARFQTEFPTRQTTLKPVAPTPKLTALPAGMLEIPAASFDMKVDFRVRECGFYAPTADAQLTFPGLHKPVTFERRVALARFAIDQAPVSNAQYAEFLSAANYRPRQDDNFLKHWQKGVPPPGQLDHPVVYVDLDDARAYARWAGKRLPTEEEWQYAAQGPQGLRYPWGSEMRPGRCNAGENGGTTPVTAFPEGRSPFGCYDMCGNTWEWTESERSDGRTRFCIIRGGSFYQAKGSDWYTDGGPRSCQFALKYLLVWPGLDRCAAIGFRCAAELG